MFKCLECGTEYSQKPDFCDCGNDTFEEIAENIKTTQGEEKNLSSKHKKTFEEQYPELSALKETLDPISVVIFVLCIILSIASFIFIKPKEQPVADNIKDKPQIERKVADIKSFWDDTPPKPEAITKKEEPTIASQINDMISKMSESKPVQQTEKPKTQPINNLPKTQPKTQTTTKPSTQQQKTQTINKPVQTQPVKKPASNTTTKPTTQQKPQTTTQTTKPNTQQKPATATQPTIPTTNPVQVKQQPAVNTAAIQAQAAQELKTFKTGLRNSLFKKINFTKVYGDGACVVDFRVDSSGRLVNRSFSKQSNNNSLNDEVYQAIMSTPTYKAPPSAYKGQTLHFSVKFQGGQYEVSLY